MARILAMTKKQPIEFVQAVRLAITKYDEAMDARCLGHAPGQAFWYHAHFVEWISSLGYHIELTGEEFESYAMTDQLS